MTAPDQLSSFAEPISPSDQSHIQHLRTLSDDDLAEYHAAVRSSTIDVVLALSRAKDQLAMAEAAFEYYSRDLQYVAAEVERREAGRLHGD